MGHVVTPRDRSGSSAALALLAALIVGASGSPSEAGYIISDGYFDLTQAQYPPGLPAPNPWYGSPNTTFYGNTTQAASSDPDEDAILIQDTGPGALTVSALSIGSGTYNLFTLDSVTGPVTVQAGQYAIFAGDDGSDDSFAGPQIKLVINGQTITYNDPTGANFVNGVLHGNSVIGSTDETVPWTVGYSAVPEPASLVPFALGILGALGLARRRRTWAA